MESITLNGKEFRRFRDSAYYVSRDAHVYSLISKKMLKHRVCKPVKGHGNTDYCILAIYFSNGRSDISLHTMVAECWIPNPGNLPEINHKDGNGMNCDADNLEWCTHSYNVKHAFDTGLNRNRRRVIQMDKDRNVIAEYDSALDAQRKTGISNASINHVCNGDRYTAGGYFWCFDLS